MASMIGSFRGLSLILTHLTFRGAPELQASAVRVVYFCLEFERERRQEFDGPVTPELSHLVPFFRRRSRHFQLNIVLRCDIAAMQRP
jgi:hypothetical protein